MEIEEIKERKHELLIGDFGWHDQAIVTLLNKVEKLGVELSKAQKKLKKLEQEEEMYVAGHRAIIDSD